MYAYRFKQGFEKDYLEESFATRDMAKEWAIKHSKTALPRQQKLDVFVIKSDESPSLVIGAANGGHWRHITGKCKECKGTGRIDWDYCEACFGHGVILSSLPYRT